MKSLLIRHALNLWGKTGKAPGWWYQAFQRLGPAAGGGRILRRRLSNGCCVELDLRDEVQRQMYFQGCYEPIEAWLFSALLRPGMVVVDAGANVGQYTLLAATAIQPAGCVHAFEPVPATFTKLKQHVTANGLANVRLNQTALWAQDALLTLTLEEKNRNNCGAFGVDFASGSGECIKAAAIALDDYLARGAHRAPDIVKLDIEGAELSALCGMRGSLEQRRPIILMEINRLACQRLGYEPNSIWRLLKFELGYNAFAIGSSSRSSHILDSLDGIDQRNVLFHQGEMPDSIARDWDLKDALRWAREGIK